MAVLCYVKDEWAYFTTQPLEKQWGDDWNDAPYEHNAGKPYEGDQHKIIKIAFDVNDYITPDYYVTSSQYSVEDINNREVPWLQQDKYCSQEREPIYAGTTLEEFKAIIKKYGGKIYTEED